MRPRARARCRSRASSTSSATTSGRPAEEVLPARAGTRSAAARRLLHHLHRRGQGRRRRGRSSCAAPTIRRRAAATPPTAARSRRRSTGCRPRTRSTPRSGSTTACSRPRTPGAAGDYRADLNPASLEVVCRAASSSRASPTRPPGTRYQFERLGYFCVDPDSHARRAGVQPHGHAQGQLGTHRGRRKPIARVRGFAVRGSAGSGR